jgi:hypothetical protein
MNDSISQFAPICLFVYNRLEHTKAVIDALLKNKESKLTDLIIFADGPKKNSSKEAIEKIEKLRSYLKTISGFKSITIRETSENLGLAKSIIRGVTETLNHYENVIVMEDDLVSSPYFLQYMNEGLNLYQNYEQVISIHGYNSLESTNLPETYFLKGADCWGWATWKRGWAIFEENGEKLLKEIKQKKLAKEFDINNSYPYIKMLQDQINGKNNSWAIRWQASAFLQNKLTLYPQRSLIKNIGFDGSGVHCDVTDIFEVMLSNQPIKVELIKIEENKIALKELERFNRKIIPSLTVRIVRKIKRETRKFFTKLKIY